MNALILGAAILFAGSVAIFWAVLLLAKAASTSWSVVALGQLGRGHLKHRAQIAKALERDWQAPRSDLEKEYLRNYEPKPHLASAPPRVEFSSYLDLIFEEADRASEHVYVEDASGILKLSEKLPYQHLLSKIGATADYPVEAPRVPPPLFGIPFRSYRRDISFSRNNPSWHLG